MNKPLRRKEPDKNMRFALEVLEPHALELFEASERLLRGFGATDLVENYAPAVRADGLIPDGLLTIVNTPARSSRYVCEAKRQISSQTLPSIISRLKESASKAGMKPLLMADYVNPNLAAILKAEDVAYIDRAGNASLFDPPFFVCLQGLKPVEKACRVSRAFQPTGLRLIAFLMKTPDAIDWPYRRLATDANLSLGSTSRILSDLRSMGFINLIGSGRNVLIHRRRLFEQWEFGYVSRLRPSLNPQTFRQADAAPIDQLAQRIPASIREDVLLGGEVAAAVATRHLRPQSITLHVPPHRQMQPLLKELRLIPDPQGNVTVIEQLAAAAVWRWQAFAAANLVHPLLVHAELLQGQADDRLRETARLIEDQYLMPLLSDETRPEQE